MYSPQVGRFLQRDPLPRPLQTNLYEYVASRPTGYTDPSGLQHSEEGSSGTWYPSPWDGPTLYVPHDDQPVPSLPPSFREQWGRPPSQRVPRVPSDHTLETMGIDREDIGKDVPGTSWQDFNCLRYAAGCGIPSGREPHLSQFWTAVDKYPEEKFRNPAQEVLSDLKCKIASRWRPCEKDEKVVAILEAHDPDYQFHALVLEKNSTWSAKIDDDQIIKDIKSPLDHTRAYYGKRGWVTSYWCCPRCSVKDRP